MKKFLKSSKKWTFFAAFFLGTAVLPAGTAFGAAVANLEMIQGEVMIHAVGTAPETWRPAAANTPLNDGDSVKTANGSCAIVYSDQATISLQPNTTVTVQEKSDSQDILLSLGKLGIKVNKEKAIKPFQVVTPTAVGAVRGTDAAFCLNENSELTDDLYV